MVLREGRGSVRGSRIAWPGDSVVPLGERENERAIPFSLVELPERVAIVAREFSLAHDPDAQRGLAQTLASAGCVAVVFEKLRAAGVGTATVWADAGDALHEAAAALWAVSAVDGSDETALMLFTIVRHESGSTLGSASSFFVRPDRSQLAAHLVVSEATRGAMRAFDGLVAERGGLSSCGVVLSDVDDMRIFNDAYGLERGHLVIDQIQRRLELLAAANGATMIRVGGDELGLVVDTDEQAIALALEVERAVEELAIPLAHPQVATASHVTVTARAMTAVDRGASYPWDALLDRMGVEKRARRAKRRVR